MSLVRGPGYSCAITPAIDHAAATCADGNDVPPLRKNEPLPSPWYGRSRRSEYFNPSTATRLFSAASLARKPVSLQCSLCLAWPNSHIPPAPPRRAATPPFESVL